MKPRKERIDVLLVERGLAESRAIFATSPVVEHPKTTDLLSASGLRPVAQQRMLRGITDEFAVLRPRGPIASGAP